MPTKIELALEQSQQGVSNDVLDCDVYDNFPYLVSKAASVPAGSRNSSASISAGIRNRPASIHAGRHIPAGRFNKPAPFPAGRYVPTGWTNHAARLFFRPTNLYFDNVHPHVNKYIGIFDSGCSRSMTGNKERLNDFVQSDSDSDYVGSHSDRKSTTGGWQFLGRRLISWQCKKQTIMATSSTEAEYVAAASCCGQVLWIQNQMLDYGFNFMNTKIFIDNQSTICIVKNLVFHQRTKHIEIRHHFIRDANEKNLIQSTLGCSLPRMNAVSCGFLLYSVQIVSRHPILLVVLAHTDGLVPAGSCIILTELASLEQTDTGKDVSNPFMAMMVCQKPLGYFSSPMIHVPRAGLVIHPPV
nr:putative ribonuclease H-like domain-containing protein [Tanacetum cinerariifolium]